MPEPWTDKYRPTTWKELQGNNTAVDDIKAWAEGWEPGDPPVLLVGVPGTGKTTTAELLADWLDLQMVEMNTSDRRDADAVGEMVGVIRGHGVDGRSLVLLDEVDSWHHATNLRPLYDALDGAANPVVMTANDEWETPDGLTGRAEVYEFKLGKRSVRSKLRKIIEAEGLDVPDETLDSLASRPDLRSAINDLQELAETGVVGDDQREYETSEWDVVDRVLTGTPDLGDVDTGSAMLWLDENVKHVYRGLELAWSYEALSRADVALMQSSRFARAIVEQVAELRISEPYYENEISYKKKSFPEWFRHHADKATGGSDEARLYRALTDFDDGEFRLGGNYLYFREHVLPVLKDLDEAEKFEFVLTYRLTPDEYAALGVTESAYEDWLVDASPEAGEWEGRTQAADAF